MFTLRQLECFTRSAHCTSFSEAARTLSVNVKAVIQLTDGLERAFGSALFTRGRKGVGGLELTPFGALVLARARLIVREARKLEELGRVEKTMGAEPKRALRDALSRSPFEEGVFQQNAMRQQRAMREKRGVK